MKRTWKIRALAIAKYLGAFGLARRLSRGGVRILCYHGIWLGDRRFAGDTMFMHADTFETRMATIRRLGYPVVTLSEAVAALRGELRLPPSAVVITIDDGWYGTYSAMRPALEKYDMPATLYCDTGHLNAQRPVYHVLARYLLQCSGNGNLDGPAREAYQRATDQDLDPAERAAAVDELKLLLDADHTFECRTFTYMTADQLREFFATPKLDVQLHTHNHTLHDFSPVAIRRELDQNSQALSELLGVPADHFRHFCYPSGRTTQSAAQTLRELGLESATTTSQGIAGKRHELHLLPRFLDGDNLSQIEFEAELSGFMDIVRSLLRPSSTPMAKANRLQQPAPRLGT
ncbi:MAG: hypothetical protein RLZ98_3581 [Pseudomonadota bacterium]|jgi:peptidoglycan/xylan/chitin deacetylase (PgdA/CDA1 family)